MTRPMGTNTSRTRDFIAALHLIAAGDAPEGRLKQAVGEVFARSVTEALRGLLGNQNLLRVWVVSLQDELTAAMIEPHTKRFEIVRSWAHELATEWLRDH